MSPMDRLARRWGSVLVVAPVVAVLVIAAASTRLDPEAGPQVAPAQGCGAVAEESIQESTNFTPYGLRRGGPIDTVPIVVSGSVTGAVVPQEASFRLTTVNGKLRQHTAVSANGSAYAYFADGPVTGLTRSQFLRAGGIQLDQDLLTDDVTMVSTLLMAFPDRTVSIAVGAFAGAVTWSDPYADGLRPHNVYWSDGRYQYALHANVSAAALVTLARSLVCD